MTGGPHQQIAEEVKKLDAEDGRELDIKVFNDYNPPNATPAECFPVKG
ncbi:hypothetical protein ACW7EJ_21440 [Acinetobacter soli]